jgi:hypothetical protein
MTECLRCGKIYKTHKYLKKHLDKCRETIEEICENGIIRESFNTESDNINFTLEESTILFFNSNIETLLVNLMIKIYEKYPQKRNIIIADIDSKWCWIWIGKEYHVELKEKALNDLIELHYWNLFYIFEKLKDSINNMNQRTKNKILSVWELYKSLWNNSESAYENEYKKYDRGFKEFLRERLNIYIFNSSPSFKKYNEKEIKYIIDKVISGILSIR